MAHDIKSPGVSVQVIDNSAFTATSQGTLAATVGFAERGPINEPTLILSKDSYLNTFGKALVDNYYMALFADKFLDVSTGYFTRIAKAVDYESVTGSVAAGLDFAGMTTPVFWIELTDFPIPNNGIFRVTIANSSYSTVDDLVSALNTAMNNVTLPDGTSKLANYLTAAKDTVGTKIVFRSDLYRNIKITLKADSGADNICKTTGVGCLGFADGASSADVGAYSYAFIRIPITEVQATNASITASAAMTAQDLNKITAFNKVNIKVDGTGANPYKSYADVNITPSVGAPATYPNLEAVGNPDLSHDWQPDTLTIQLAGFYSFKGTNLTTDVNKVHTVTGFTYTGGSPNLASLITDLNNRLAAVTVGTGATLKDYIKFEANGTKVRLVKGDTATLYNYGSQCTTKIAATTGAIANLGYTITTNDTGTGTNSTYTASGVADKINSLVTEVLSAASTSIITIGSRRLGGTSFVKIENATTLAENAIDLLHFTDGTTDTGDNASTSGVVNFVCKEAGTWGNKLKVRTTTSTNPVTSAIEYNIEIFEGENSVEIWRNVNWTNASATNFVKTVLEASVYVMVDFSETIEYPSTDLTTTPPTTSCPNSGSPNPDYWQLASGSNGIPTDGDEIDSLATTALEEYENKEQYIIDLLLTPGFVGSPVLQKMVNVAESRKDILVLCDPPSGLDWKDAIDWHNGTYPDSINLNSSYAVAYWGWQKDYDNDNSQYVDLPPSIYGAVAIARTQKNFELWEAPAGPIRGVVNSISSYTKPTQAQREYLNNDIDPACVNPLVQFPAEGTLIYGQKTCLKQSKAENRINVKRLVNHVRRNVERIGKGYIFQLSTPTTWANLKRELDTFLGNILTRGGLYAYTTICDASTNTPDMIDSNIMYAKVYIQPTKVAERIFIDITIQRTGAKVS
jgi:hypothetical protein